MKITRERWFTFGAHLWFYHRPLVCCGVVSWRVVSFTVHLWFSLNFLETQQPSIAMSSVGKRKRVVLTL